MEESLVSLRAARPFTPRNGYEVTLRKLVIVQASNKSAANSPVEPSAPEGPARTVLAVPDEPARGRKPVLRNELGAVVTIHRYPPERLRKLWYRYMSESGN